MASWEAPAKLNLSLLVSAPRSDGYHPINSVVQTIEWCDQLVVEQVGEERLEVSGAEIDPDENLVTRVLDAVRGRADVEPLSIELVKEIPSEAGLGGGSSDAAAMLKFIESRGWLESSTVAEVAIALGADIPLFFSGGTQLVSGVGHELSEAQPLSGFVVAVVVPPFGLSTAEVYRRWDDLEGPEGDVVPDASLPPQLRGLMPMRNDLLPAALDLEPLLGDFMADVRQVWGSAVALTGSGSACFGYLPTLDEASDAAESVSHLTSRRKAAELRPHGVAPA